MQVKVIMLRWYTPDGRLAFVEKWWRYLIRT